MDMWHQHVQRKIIKKKFTFDDGQNSDGHLVF